MTKCENLSAGEYLGHYIGTAEPSRHLVMLMGYVVWGLIQGQLQMNP